MVIQHVTYPNLGNVFRPESFDETSRVRGRFQIPLGACYGRTGHSWRNGTHPLGVCLLSQTRDRNCTYRAVPTRGARPWIRLLGAAVRSDVWPWVGEHGRQAPLGPAWTRDQ